MLAYSPAVQLSRISRDEYFYVALQQNDSHKPIPRIAVVFMASELKTPAVPVLLGGQSGHHVGRFASAGPLPAALLGSDQLT